MKKILFLFLLPHLVFGLSETELESLEESGKKTFSESPWRFELGFSFLRNLQLETRHQALGSSARDNEEDQGVSDSWCDFSKSGSICDLSDLYYRSSFTAYYSLDSWMKAYKFYEFLKGTELFVQGAFRSNFAGGSCANLLDYQNPKTGRTTFRGYIRCGLEDIVLGWTTPVYQKEKLFSFLSFSVILYPLSKRSQDVSLNSSLTGTKSFLYFIEKRKKWSWSVSSSHSFGYNNFTYATANESASSYNRPFDSSQNVALIFRQSFNKYLPSRTQISSSYIFALNTYKTLSEECDYSLFKEVACGSREHYFSLGAGSSWRLLKRAFLSASVSWRDLVLIHNPIDENVSSSWKTSFGWHKWYFSIKGTYSF